MKRRNAFTLIELLAIIVILAIIAVITVPIILNIIDNSKKGAVADSAYGYKDAINKMYVSKLTENPEMNRIDGVYLINSDGNLKKTNNEIYDVTVSGQHPTAGYIVIENNQISGCLVYEDYSVNINDGRVTNNRKGNCKYATQDDAKISGELTKGDLVCINGTEECFFIISNENGITSMLARYNLLVGYEKVYPMKDYQEILSTEEGYGLQSTNAKWQYGSGKAVVSFSESNYWKDSVGIGSQYSYQGRIGENTNYYIDPQPYVYDVNSNLFEYINNYANNLNGAYISKSRLMTKNEANEMKDVEYNNSYIMSMSGNFWFGDAFDSEQISAFLPEAPYGIWGVQNYYARGGVRPVIEIPTSSIELKSE